MNRSIFRFGLAKQASTTAVAPTVASGASESSPGIDAAVTSEPVDVTTNGTGSVTVGRYQREVDATASVTTIATADLLGLLCTAALGSDTVTGASAPYTHDIKQSEGLMRLTYTEQKGSASAPIQKLLGCIVNNLTLSAEATAPVKVAFDLAGIDPAWASGAWSGADIDLSVGWFTAAGCEVLFSPNTDSPSALSAGIALASAEVSIANNVSKQTTLGKASPVKQTEGAPTVTVSLSGTTDSTELYRIIKTGSASGTAIADDTVVGSLQITFEHSVESWQLVIKLPAVPWTIDALNADPAGGAFDLSLSTEGAIAGDDGAIEIILQNDVASY